jgi:hypothetical protein
MQTRISASTSARPLLRIRRTHHECAPPLSCVTDAQDASEAYHRDNYGSESSAAGLNDYDHPGPYGSSLPVFLNFETSQLVFSGHPDTDSDHGVYGQCLGP